MRGAVGGALRVARLRVGLSLEELARRSGGRYRPSSLGGYERGERTITVPRFCDLAQLLGIPPDQLLGDALGRVDPQHHREVVLDLSELPDSPIGRQVAKFAHGVKSVRRDYRSNIVTLRAGDLEVIAYAGDLRVPQLLSSLGEAVLRVGAQR